MKRREFITLLGGVAVAWPLAARAQQPTMPVVGWLGSGTEPSERHLLTAFRDGLAEGGFVVGRNVTIEYRAAEGRYDRLPAMVAEFDSQQGGSNCGERSSGCACGEGHHRDDSDCLRYRL